MTDYPKLPLPNPVIAGPCRCGARSVMRKQKKFSGEVYAVECSRDGCGSQGAWRWSGADAAKDWNRQQEANEN